MHRNVARAYDPRHTETPIAVRTEKKHDAGSASLQIRHESNV